MLEIMFVYISNGDNILLVYTTDYINNKINNC